MNRRKESLQKVFQAFFQYPYQPLVDMDKLMDQPIKALKEFLNREIVTEVNRMEKEGPFDEVAKQEYIKTVQKAIKETKKSHKRCNFESCKKKLNITAVPCGCGYKFCGKHSFFTDHKCELSTNDKKRDNLKKSLPKIIPSKLNTI